MYLTWICLTCTKYSATDVGKNNQRFGRKNSAMEKVRIDPHSYLNQFMLSQYLYGYFRIFREVSINNLDK